MKSLVLLFLMTMSPAFEYHWLDKHADNEHVVQNVFKAFNQHDWHAMTALYAEGATFLDPSFGSSPVARSRAETVAHYTELASMFPDVQDSVISMLSAENKVVVEFISTGTGPDGIKWKLPICTIFTLKDGQIIRDATYYDEF